MKMLFSTLIGLSVFLLGALVSCESTNSRKAGGGAFDDSYLGPRLDANSAIEDGSSPSSDSYEQWRNQD